MSGQKGTALCLCADTGYHNVLSTTNVFLGTDLLLSKSSAAKTNRLPTSKALMYIRGNSSGEAILQHTGAKQAQKPV